ncbi:MAG: DUF4091 domain-containing protein [Clostridia bacterium]|nr:DUF4091 domain-containing protein [Clostridia bacterium]
MVSKDFVFLQLSSLNKVFLDENHMALSEVKGTCALKGEKVSYQILYTGGAERWTACRYSICADQRIKVNTFKVGNVPCEVPAFSNETDCHYLRTTPGLYPDVLYPDSDKAIDIKRENKHSLFVTAEIPEDIPSGSYSIEITFEVKEVKVKKVFEITVIDALLPKQELTYTQWFYADCIASYYGYEMYSEEHWAMIEKFVVKAKELGINMILTPIFTVALDTEEGGERPTHQLVDVEYIGGEYTFGFDRLERWIEMCQRCGIHKFEMSHLFTQWGSGCMPKIEAKTENGTEKIFGWHVKSESEEYKEFLRAFLPGLTDFLKNQGVYEDSVFHISDEPKFEKDYETYKAQREMLEGYVESEKIIDAISHYEFCECGLVKKPVALTYYVDAFYEKGFKDIWTYYCCGPCIEGYSNRFIAMPSGRNRITGFQLYKYDIDGFLHWGYNFYYSELSRRVINPFQETDAGGGMQSGDAFTVYPGTDGPLDSLRGIAFFEGLQDLRACKLLERYIGRDEVVKIIEESGEIRFNQFPRTDSGVLEIRERINKKLISVIG